MRILLSVFVFLFISSELFANDACCEPPKPKNKIVWKTRVIKEKQPVVNNVRVETTKIKPPNNNHNSQTMLNHRSRTSTGNQNQRVIVNIPKQTTRIIKIIKHKTAYRKVFIQKPLRKNRLQLLVGQSKTKIITELNGCCQTVAVPKKEFDYGLQYLRDFGKFTASVGITRSESWYFGAGFNW